ncbi:MAG: DNA polymerase I, partial [Muribaculaceae bacterium]|nr:DNA polymerase I [Muribaculaceae bacterium]
MAACDVVAIAVNAPGEEAMRARFEGIAICGDECDAVYLPYPVSDDSRRRYAAVIQPLFAGKTIVASHDVKRDMLLLRRIGVDFSGENYFDTAVAHYLIDSEAKHTLPVIMDRYLGLEPVSMADPKNRFTEVSPTPDMATGRYCEEADAVRRLYGPLTADIEAEGMTHLLREIELPMVRVLAEMEWTGVRIAPDELREQSLRFTARISEMEEEAYRLAGARFNISSPSQVGEILFGKLNLDPKAKKTTRGAYATTEKILEKHRKDHPVVDLILKIRKLRKLTATYLDALPALINPATGKIHTTYNQTVAATGRLSSTNPNLQNIPIRTDDGREIRRAFISDPGDLFMSADYSQIELRLMADLSGDEGMIEAFLSGADIHRATAAKIYHENLDDVTDEQRRNAKTANFGIIYGISAFGLSERLGIPRGEAKELIEGYLATYPAVARYMSDAIEKARIDGFVSTIMGRKRYLPDINSRSNTVRSYAERNAINAPLQGSAADIIKVAMVRIDSAIRAMGLRSRMIMQVHDDL